ncbi:MAG: Yip1 family protein [Phycisphaerales bacterium]
MPAPLPDADALLCEHCGYPIAGLSETTPCPECAKPAGESWPGTRPGSRYQNAPKRPGRWFWSTIEILREPRAVFRRVRIEPRSSWPFLFTNLMIAATVAAGGYVIATRNLWLDASVAIWIGVFGGLLLMTYIETLGLRFYARAASRRWRITPAVAWTVCHHASVGWIVGSAAMALVWATDPAGRLLEAQWFNAWLTRSFSGQTVNDWYLPLRITQMLAPVLIGVLAFETLVYLGTRQCRYANSPASVAQQGPA